MTAACADQHYRSPRPRTCRCGQPAAFWTLPDGDCQVCGKPQAIYAPDGDGQPSHPWCVGCRDRFVLNDEVQP